MWWVLAIRFEFSFKNAQYELILSFFFLPFKFSFWQTIYSKKKDILETATVNFPPFFFLYFFCIGNYVIPQNHPQIFLDFSSSY